MLLNDCDIRALARGYTIDVGCLCTTWGSGNEHVHTELKIVPFGKMIEPFAEPTSGNGIISFGLTSGGYDLRLDNKILVFKNTYGEPIDPKLFKDPEYLKKMFDEIISNEFFIIPPGSYCLGQSMEYLRIPRRLKGRCVGKSTYARCGILINTTPLEPCLTPDHEILCYGGWKGIADVAIGDMVLTRREDGIAEYQFVERKQERWYEGNVYGFHGKSVDLVCTPEHSIFAHVRTGVRTYRTGTFCAASMHGKHGYQLDRHVFWFPEFQESEIEIGNRNYNLDDFVDFYGCWLGDGSAYKGSDGGYHIKLAVVTKAKKKQHYEALLKRMGINPRVEDRGFHWHDKALFEWLEPHGQNKTKFIYRPFLMLPSHLSQRLLDALLLSNGDQKTKTFTTASKRLADDFQELAYKCGHAAIVRECYTEYGYQYKVRVCDKHMTPKLRPKYQDKFEYKGMVYDITVPNHVFFVRRNGKACWTGNCWEGNLTIEIGNDTQSPIKIYPGEGIAQLEFEIMTDDPQISYKDKIGKYDKQTDVTPAIVK